MPPHLLLVCDHWQYVNQLVCTYIMTCKNSISNKTSVVEWKPIFLDERAIMQKTVD